MTRDKMRENMLSIGSTRSRRKLRDVMKRNREEVLHSQEMVKAGETREKKASEGRRNAGDPRRRRRGSQREISMRMETSGCSTTSSQRRREITYTMRHICLSSR